MQGERSQMGRRGSLERDDSRSDTLQRKQQQPLQGRTELVDELESRKIDAQTHRGGHTKDRGAPEYRERSQNQADRQDQGDSFSGKTLYRNRQPLNELRETQGITSARFDNTIRSAIFIWAVAKNCTVPVTGGTIHGRRSPQSIERERAMPSSPR